MLESFTQRCKEQQRQAQPIHYEAKAPRVVATLQIPVNFADCLDWEGLDVVVPVLTQAYVPQPVEPLPWD